jgi:CMP-N-acetylneuraminic acid synthetase
MFKHRGDFLEKYDLSNNERSIPRQLLPKIFVKDGGYYVFRSELLSQERYLGTEILPYIRSGINCINIDTIEDLHYARYISKIKRANDRYLIKFLKKFGGQVRVME